MRHWLPTATLAVLAGCGKVESLAADAGASFTVAVAENAFVRRAESIDVQVTVDRGAFASDITIVLPNLPSGVTADDVVIASGSTAGIVSLDANNAAVQGLANVTVRGIGAGSPTSDATLRLLVGGPPGTLDESFAAAGKFATQAAILGRGIAATARGTLATGAGPNLATTVLLSEAGVPDPGFGMAGFSASGTGDFSEGLAVTEIADGSVIVAGVAGGPGGGGDLDFGIYKYTAAGALDPTFGVNGIAAFDPGVGFGEIHSLVIDPNANLVIAGVLFPAAGGIVGRLLRYSSAGVRDVAFDVTETNTAIDGSLLQPDGKLVACGTLNSDFWVARYNPNGTKDASFGTAGVVTTSFSPKSSAASAVIGLAGGKLLVVGIAGGNVALVRYNANGSLDTTFAGSGKLTTVAGFGTRALNSAVVDDQGRILVVGFVGTAPSVQRILSEGAMDPSFALGGVNPVDFGIPGQTNSTGGFGIAIDADKRIVFGGEVGAAGNQHMVVGRLWP